MTQYTVHLLWITWETGSMLNICWFIFSIWRYSHFTEAWKYGWESAVSLCCGEISWWAVRAGIPTLFGLETVVLRYFNVFGPRQDPASFYSAVIPIFISAALEGRAPTINGDGGQTRDFTYVDNVVSAKLFDNSASHRLQNVTYWTHTRQTFPLDQKLNWQCVT